MPCQHPAGSGFGDGNCCLVYLLVCQYLHFSDEGCTAFADFRLADEDIVDSGIIPGFHIYRPPDAGGDEAGAPVPSVVVTSFAGEYADFLIEYSAVLGLVVAGFILVRQGVPLGNIHFDGGVEIDFQYVLTGFQVGLDAGFPFAEHVVGFQYLLLVQVYVGIRIQSFEDEVDVLPSHHFGGELEGGLVYPVFFVNPLHAALVEAEERVFDDFVVHQVGVHHSGHGGGIPVA